MAKVDYLNILHLLNTNIDLVSNRRIDYYKRDSNYFPPSGLYAAMSALERKFNTKIKPQYNTVQHDWDTVVVPSLKVIRRDYFYKKTGMISDINQLSLENLFFLIYLSCIWVFNKKKEHALTLLLSNSIKNHSVASLTTILNFIVTRKTTIYRFLKDFLADIFKQEEIYGLSTVLTYCDVENFTFDHVCNILVNDHKLFLYDILAQQEFINNNKHKNIPLEKLSNIAEQRSILYTQHNNLNKTFSPLYMLLNGFFTTPRYFNLEVPLSIIDILWYTYELGTFYTYLNRLEPMTFSFIYRDMLPKINNLDFYQAKYVRVNLKRVLLPVWNKLSPDIASIIQSETANTPVPRDYAMNLTLCRKGIQQYWTAVPK